MSLVTRIKELCKDRSLSLQSLESETGLGTNTIYKWDKAYPSADKLQSVADFFDVSVDYLLGRERGDGDMTDQLEMLHKNPKLRVLLSSGSKLDSKGIEAVINIIDQMNKE